ncbi:MAG TPA: hypothetical protein VE781_00145 [Kineosporiaceae bacterium]|nr:hypothetical protein [Kineosporiaceae bacterium]
MTAGRGWAATVALLAALLTGCDGRPAPRGAMSVYDLDPSGRTSTVVARTPEEAVTGYLRAVGDRDVETALAHVSPWYRPTLLGASPQLHAYVADVVSLRLTRTLARSDIAGGWAGYREAAELGAVYDVVLEHPIENEDSGRKTRFFVVGRNDGPWLILSIGTGP